MKPEGRGAGRELLRKCLIEGDEEACRILREILKAEEEVD